MNTYHKIEARLLFACSFFLAQFFNLLYIPLGYIREYVMNESFINIPPGFALTAFNHLIFLLLSLVPFFLALTIPKGLYLRISIRNKIWFLFVGLIFYVLYTENNVGLESWITNPRIAYENTRVGYIWLWSLIFTLLSFYSVGSLLESKSLFGYICSILSATLLLYLSGSKQFILSFFFFLLAFYIAKKNIRIPLLAFFISIAGCASVYVLSLSFGEGFEIKHLALYFDYFANGENLLSAVIDGSYRPNSLDVFFSEFYSYIPRGLGFDKPEVTGQLIYNYDLGIGNPEEGYSPAILRSAVAYADAGIFYPIFYFVLDPKYTVSLILLCLINCYNKCKNRKRLLVVLKFGLALFVFPNFLLFYPFPLQLLCAFIVINFICVEIFFDNADRNQFRNL